MKDQPRLVVLVLAGAAERWGCPARASPLAGAATPHLDRLAGEGRVFGVHLCERPRDPEGVAPLLALLGIDPARHETARASYLAALVGARIEPGECFLSADLVTLFRDTLADAEPGPFRPAETAVLLDAAGAPLQRAGFRLVAGEQSHHVAIGPRSAVDAALPSPERMLGRDVGEIAPGEPAHALAHQLAREALDAHEVNVVRRDLGQNGADMVWLWGPGGSAVADAPREEAVEAVGTDIHFRAVCTAAGIPVTRPDGDEGEAWADATEAALDRAPVCYVYADRCRCDALLRDARARAEGLASIDAGLVGPLAARAAARGGRLLVVPDCARDTDSGRALADPVPALVWGRGIQALSRRPFTEEGAARAGEPLAPGHGLVAWVQRV